MVQSEKKRWENYEQVAQYLLDQFSAEFGLSYVEPKQHLEGIRSGDSWEIDAKGIRAADGAFLIVECRRWVSSRLSKEDVGALAYRIIDTGAAGGIIVSPLALQVGAARVASAENVDFVRLTPDSTVKEYIMEFLNRVFVGCQDNLTITLKESATIKKFDASGNPVDESNTE